MLLLSDREGRPCSVASLERLQVQRLYVGHAGQSYQVMLLHELRVMRLHELKWLVGAYWTPGGRSIMQSIAATPGLGETGVATCMKATCSQMYATVKASPVLQLRSRLPQLCGCNALRRTSPPARLLDTAWQPVAGEVQRQYGRFVNVYAGFTSEETKRKWKWSRQMDQERRFWVKCLKFWAGAPWTCLNPDSSPLSD